MLKTDYSVVAENYDRNRDRVEFEYEPIIAELLQSRPRIRVLDLGCGTANYIHCQNTHYGNDKRIEWTGLDPSPDMLSIAKRKESDVTYIHAKAEEMEFEAGHFDFVVCNFVYHHIEKKGEAFDRVRSTLKEGGVFKIKNIAPEFMRAWWVFYYCPEAYYEDLHRFWGKDLLVYELEKRGFKTTVKMECREKSIPTAKILEDYIRRDTSELAMVDDAVYEKGLEKLRKEMAEGRTEYRNAFALIQIEARRDDLAIVR